MKSPVIYVYIIVYSNVTITAVLPHSTAPLSSGLTEPSCDIITKAQKLQDEAERSWTLSQACAYYQHRCPPGEQDKESCIRIMGESCSARVLQCSLLNTMQNLEPATQTHVQGEEEELLVDVSRLSSLEKHRCCTVIFLLRWSLFSQQQCVARDCLWCRTSHSLALESWVALLPLQAAGPGWSTCS